mgnify:FL=1|jgi:hypothetical protein
MGKQIKSIDSLSDKELKEIREIQELIRVGVITPTLINSLMMSVVMNLFRTYFSIVDNMDVIDKELHVMLTDTVDMILKENKELDDSDRINIMVKLIKKVNDRINNPSLILRSLPIFHKQNEKTKSMTIENINDLAIMAVGDSAKAWISGFMEIGKPKNGYVPNKIMGDA